MKAVVILKSGHKIVVPLLKDVDSFIQSILGGVKPEVLNNYYTEGPFMVNFAEVAAIYPLDWQEGDNTTG